MVNSDTQTDHSQTAVLVMPDGQRVSLPGDLYRVMLQAITDLQNGCAITVKALKPELSTSEAAELLNLTRPTVVKLVDTGVIPHVKHGRHRRIALTDLLAYDKQSRVERREALARIVNDELEDE